ncbi:cytochrome P450 [Haloarchaeobius sp. TZWWS8]|uniref:cytochrome P450 n=1 Tax=Haloarchaeobius sp. TZWWS8 TaxID=3446121 RepID=UPI003EBC940B
MPKSSTDWRPPGPRGLPILGNTLDASRDLLSFRTAVARTYGPIASFETLGQEFCLLTDPDLIEQVLVHENQRYVKGDLFQRLLSPVVGKGLLTSEGEFWRRQRHLIQPAFAPEALAHYADVMVEETEAWVDGWDDGEVHEMHEEMLSLAGEIVARALFGVDVSDRTEVVGEGLDAIMAYSENLLASMLPDWLPLPKRRRLERSMEELDAVVADIVEERRQDPGEDVVSALLAAEDEDGQGMSDQQIRDEVMTLFLAGHETTALTLSFTLFALAQQPAVERRLVDELDEALGGDPPTVADLRKLDYLDKVVTESMRLYPPVHAIVREPTQDVELGGFTIPAGTPISMPQWTVHRDPEYYDDPMTLRPERWTDEFESQLPRYAYFPFGGGPRRCIGDRMATMEAKLLLAIILQEYHLELVSDPKLDLAASITTRPKSPIAMRLHERE